MSNTVESMGINHFFFQSLISGSIAGLMCDLIFFPLDTLKTRLQSQHGFVKSGGFKRLYQGLGPVMLGSAPSASFFFVTYEGMKEVFQPRIPQQYHLLIYMTAAAMGEMVIVFPTELSRILWVACVIRVPVEVVKQRKQALLYDKHRLPLRTLYRGYGSTVLRDLPFGLVQMSLWEYFKHSWKMYTGLECTPTVSAVCGSVSVAISATMTTPLDVAKTRIMLSNTSADKKEIKISVMLKEVYQKCGVRGLFAGFLPRMGSFTIGGFIFFGVYEKMKLLCMGTTHSNTNTHSIK